MKRKTFRRIIQHKDPLYGALTNAIEKEAQYIAKLKRRNKIRYEIEKNNSLERIKAEMRKAEKKFGRKYLAISSK